MAAEKVITTIRADRSDGMLVGYETPLLVCAGDDPSVARGFGRIANSFLEDKDRRRQRGWDIPETLTREQ